MCNRYIRGVGIGRKTEAASTGTTAAVAATTPTVAVTTTATVAVTAAAATTGDNAAAVAAAAAVVCAYKLDVEQIRREILCGGRGRRACSEQGPHPRDVQQQQHLWAGGGRAWTGRSPWAVKRTSAPAMTTQNSGSMRVALVLRTRRSWPVAPLKTRRLVRKWGPLVYRPGVQYRGRSSSVSSPAADKPAVMFFNCFPNSLRDRNARIHELISRNGRQVFGRQQMRNVRFPTGFRPIGFAKPKRDSVCSYIAKAFRTIGRKLYSGPTKNGVEGTADRLLGSYLTSKCLYRRNDVRL